MASAARLCQGETAVMAAEKKLYTIGRDAGDWARQVHRLAVLTDPTGGEKHWIVADDAA